MDTVKDVDVVGMLKAVTLGAVVSVAGGGVVDERAVAMACTSDDVRVLR